MCAITRNLIPSLTVAILAATFTAGVADEITISREASVTAGGNSSGLQTSHDGSMVVFLSDAPDIVDGVPEGRLNLFRKNLSTNTAEWIGLDAPGSIESYSMSGDGGRIAVCLRRGLDPTASTPATSDVYLWSDTSGLRRISESANAGEIPDHDSWDPWITPDGRFVFFKTRANNLLPDHFFGEYGFGVVRYDVEGGVPDAGVPVFTESVDSDVLYSPDGNLVYTRQELPASWNGESPFEGQTTSRLINVFNIAEQRVIVPPVSPELPTDEFVGDPSTIMRLDPSGRWVSIVTWWLEERVVFAFNVESLELTPGPALDQDRLRSGTPIASGDFFQISDTIFTLWNQKRGVLEHPKYFGDNGYWREMEAATSPDNLLIAAWVASYVDQAFDRIMVWTVDAGEWIEFDPNQDGMEPRDLGQPNFVFSGDSRFLFFETAHPGFVENDNNKATDLFRYTIDTGEILLISARNPDLPLPHDGFTVSAPLVENAVTRIFHKHAVDSDEPWIEAATTPTDDGRVKFKDVGSTIHRHKFYKSEVVPVDGQ